MGTVEILQQQLNITSHIILYGSAASAALAVEMQEEIESMWNEPAGRIQVKHNPLSVRFFITAHYEPQIAPLDILSNTNPRNNYFRVEEYARGNISFVDGLGCNTGYFKLENLYQGSTTAAHEYGHTLGLPHPEVLDFRGHGVPGIMYPRGTLVDACYQYDPQKPAGLTGGTMHPRFRKVRQEDIDQLRLHRLTFTNNTAVIGEFSSQWHEDHRTVEQ